MAAASPGKWRRAWWLTTGCINIGLMIVSWSCMEQADCRPTRQQPPYNATGFDQEGLLVDLLNRQQGEFLAKLEGANHPKSSQPNGPVARTANKWTPLDQGQFVPMASSGEPIIKLVQIGGTHGTAESTKTKPGEPCDRKRQAPTLEQQASNPVDRNEKVPQEKRAATSRQRPDGEVAPENGFGDERKEEADEDDDDEDKLDGNKDGASQRSAAASGAGDLLDGRESITHGSSMMPPHDASDSEQYLPSNQRSAGPSEDTNEEEEQAESEQEPSENANGKQEEVPDAEAAERREQEAAEASEAEAADRSALAEQQQQQREIILAQAQSEAKAIREQQEALLKQQQLQQQMLMRRNQNFLDDESRGQQRDRHERRQDKQQQYQQYQQQQKQQKQKRKQQYRQLPEEDEARQGGARSHRPEHGAKHSHMRASQSANQQQQVKRNQHQRSNTDNHSRQAINLDSNDENNQQQYGEMNQVDNQFSDQPDNGVVDRGTASSTRPMMHNARQQQQHGAEIQAADELGSGEDSISLPQYERAHATAPGDDLSSGVRPNLTDAVSPDLIAAAQHHHYGIHYGSLDGHQEGFGGYIGGQHKKKSADYHQYASSHKKGQYDSGFKRGNKKFVIAGHSSQHKNHAEGHVKWQAKKGKGNHSWDYKHKNKKHYGGGYGYGGGHHYY